MNMTSFKKFGIVGLHCSGFTSKRVAFRNTGLLRHSYRLVLHGRYHNFSSNIALKIMYTQGRIQELALGGGGVNVLRSMTRARSANRSEGGPGVLPRNFFG